MDQAGYRLARLDHSAFAASCALLSVATGVSAVAAGLVVGLAWEAFEWTIGIIGGVRDTSIDLVMDTAGALLAAALLRWLASSGASTRAQREGTRAATPV